MKNEKRKREFRIRVVILLQNKIQTAIILCIYVYLCLTNPLLL